MSIWQAKKFAKKEFDFSIANIYCFANLRLMPRKLKRVLAQLALVALTFGVILWAMDAIQNLGHFESFWKIKVGVWSCFLIVVAYKIRKIYVGLYRDGTFFFDEDEDQ